MEQFFDKVERIKCYVNEILNDYNLQYLYSGKIIEDYVFNPANTTVDAYKTALLITDNIIFNANTAV